MNHSYFSDRISAFKDGALPPYEQAAIAEHLKQCNQCRAALAKLEKLDRLVDERSGLDGRDYWEDLAQRTEHRIGLEETRVTDIRPAGRGWGLGWKWISVAASVAILTFIGLHQSDIFRDE